MYRSGMAAKKKINKTQFVKALPKAMSAKDVVRKAKESGITISEAYVYTIRSAASRAAGKSGSAPAAKVAAAPKKSVGRPAGKSAGTSAGKSGKSPKVTAYVMHTGPVAPSGHVAHATPHAPAAKKTAKKHAKKQAKKHAGLAHMAHVGHEPLGTSAAHASPSGSAERRFVDLVADIGLRRAEIFLQQFRGQVGRIKVG